VQELWKTSEARIHKIEEKLNLLMRRHLIDKEIQPQAR
jgi:hypothetical protein